MSRRATGLALAAVLVGVSGFAAACADISAPTRSAAYEWRLFVGGEPITFHWPESRLPVLIWAEDEFDMPALVAAGAEQWHDAFLYNEFRYALTDDSTEADVIVRASAPPAGLRLIRLGSMLAPECQGATDLDIPPENPTVLNLPIRAYVYPRLAPDTPGFDACMALTTTHELGHALGIFQHSPDPADIMFSNPVVAVPSQADRATAEVVYHVPATVRVRRSSQ